MRSLPLVIAALCTAAASGCNPAAVDSTLTGTIAQASFPAPVEKVTAVSSTGAVTTAVVDAAGAFSLDLGGSGTYRFLLSPDGKSTPLVVRTDTGRLETQLTVTGTGAAIDLGEVRYWAGSSATPLGLTVTPGTTTGACVAGVVQGSTQPCSSGVAAQVCTDMGGGMCGGRPMTTTPTPATPVVVSDPATDASATESVAIPRNALPASIGCAEPHHHHH